MTDLVILGTDTDAGKTTFALLWLAAFGDAFEYWKPVETGPSDSESVRELIPGIRVHAPLKRFAAAVAPPLAARQENQEAPTAAAVFAGVPQRSNSSRRLLIESFGSPFSPLNDSELQLTWLQLLRLPAVLVSSSTLGAIGRTLQTIEALAARSFAIDAVVLLGAQDDYAHTELCKHQAARVFSLLAPRTWDGEGIRRAASEQHGVLLSLHGQVTCDDSPRSLPARRPRKNGHLAPDLIARDRRAVWHPYTSLQDPDPPLEVVSAQDEFLFLADGRRVIDGISSWWTILHGHRHPALLAALAQATRAIDHVHFAGVTHAPAVEFAELLLATMPWSGGRVFYSDNGSTAVEVALKMAYQYWCHRGAPKRTAFVGFAGGYHGDTFGAMAVSRDPVFFGRFEPLLFRAEILPLDATVLDDWLEKHGRETAAVIVEPLVQGAGGMRIYAPELLKALHEATRKHDVLFIADEVMTAGGRTGWLWAHQSAGIAPDLICAGKTLAGGLLPLAATLAAPRVVAAWETSDRGKTFFHGHSFTGHPLACAVGAQNWRLLTTQPLDAPRRMEAFWNDALAPLRDLPQVREVRVRGSIAAVELNVAGGYLANVGRQLRDRCLSHDVLLRPLGSVLYALPPFCTSHDSLQQIAVAMSAAVRGLS